MTKWEDDFVAPESVDRMKGAGPWDLTPEGKELDFRGSSLRPIPSVVLILGEKSCILA